MNTCHPLLAGLILAFGLSTCFRSEAAASLPTVSAGTGRAHECVSEAKENAERNPGCAAHAEAAPSATRARRFLQLDVFSGHPGSGNPLAVILDSEGLDTAGMQALAAWLNLSETIFFVPVTDGAADYHIRIFTPRSELPFAGHPSVGAAWAAVHTGRAAPRNGTLVQQCGAGLLPVAVEESNGQRSITVRSPPARQLEAARPELPAALADIAAPGTEPSQWSNGSTWWLMEAGDEAALRALRPDSNAIVEQLPGGKIAAYAFSEGPEYQMTTRAFAPGVGVAEDPVNGNANAMIAAHLHRQGRLPGQEGRYIVSQGRELGRDGKIMVRVDAEGEVWIGGQVQSVIEGILHW